jgi:hypothetical protein
MPRLSKFVIFSPAYHESRGGTIALHKLCLLINELGYDAKMCPVEKNRVVRLDALSPCPFEIEQVEEGDLRGRIAVYPEIVSGNPLGSQRVVRWFLHKPGFHTNRIDFGEGELYFFYKPEFNDERINPFKDRQLKVFDIKTDVYFDRGYSPRRGFCYLVRKGKGRPLDYHPRGSIRIDDLSHDKVAEIFNRCEFFMSYDMDSMYSRYAVMCGCKSILVPHEGLSKSDWLKAHEKVYGIAYGYDDLPWAFKTKDRLLEKIESDLSMMKGQVERFVNICSGYFE